MVYQADWKLGAKDSASDMMEGVNQKFNSSWKCWASKLISGADIVARSNAGKLILSTSQPVEPLLKRGKQQTESGYWDAIGGNLP